MREIKFKWWSFYAKEFTEEPELDNNGSMEINRFFKNDGFGIWCQYTGLKDENNKEIYEGDILETFQGNYLEVVFQQGCFYLKNKDGIIELHRIIYSSELVGNIYENPELLEDTQ